MQSTVLYYREDTLIDIVSAALNAALVMAVTAGLLLRLLEQSSCV